jgi:menaquinone-specific isochorismate synthase
MTPGELVERIAARLQEAAAGVRYYGGFRFDPSTSVSPLWQAFGRGWFVLPRFELVQDEQGTRLACNAFPGRDSAGRVLDDLRTLVACDAGEFSRLPVAVARHDLPDREAWTRGVAGVLAELDGRQLGKLVLARRSSIDFDGELDPLAMLERLGPRSGPCYHFYFNPDGQAAFLGASPERLFRRAGRQFSTEAVAGTRPRGHSAGDDRALREQLLHCGKEGLEHACVVRHLRRRLMPLVSVLEQDSAAGVLGLPQVQHLHVGLRGELAPGVGDADLIARLHPTPAVAGDPPEAALSRLAAVEPFDRGWYAGPVGYVGAEESEFAVAIRSGLVHRRRLELFVGAGIVPGSVAGDEWAELDSKMSGLQVAWADE